MISILRLGHRIFRDQRTTTHCALIARALGAQKLYYSGEKDSNLEQSLAKTAQSWGGRFHARYVTSPLQVMKKFRGPVVHLTAYGQSFQKKLPVLRKQSNILVVIGGEKVPPEIYQQATHNLAVGNQPHSEVAALGIFLYELRKRSFPTHFSKARLRIVPQERGKLVKKSSK